MLFWLSKVKARTGVSGTVISLKKDELVKLYCLIVSELFVMYSIFEFTANPNGPVTLSNTLETPDGVVFIIRFPLVSDE